MLYETPSVPAAVCALCGAGLPRGYQAWYINGQTICQRCFPDFAQAQYLPYAIICGRERP